MKLIRLFFILIVTSVSLSPAQTPVDISRSGRKIQLDGFLVDWIENNRQAWNGSTVWTWDAVNTEEGVAGYFHTSSAVACSSWIFTADAFRLGPVEMVVAGAPGAEGSFYRVNRVQQGGQGSVTVEWLFPWDSIAIDSNGAYAVTFGGISGCGDSLEPVLVTGKICSKARHLPSRFFERLSLIIVLLVVFIVLQVRIRKRTRRKV